MVICMYYREKRRLLAMANSWPHPVSFFTSGSFPLEHGLFRIRKKAVSFHVEMTAVSVYDRSNRHAAGALHSPRRKQTFGRTSAFRRCVPGERQRKDIPDEQTYASPRGRAAGPGADSPLRRLRADARPPDGGHRGHLQRDRLRDERHDALPRGGRQFRARLHRLRAGGDDRPA